MSLKQRPTLTPSNGISIHSHINNSFSHSDRERERKRRAAENIGKEFHTIDFNSLDISLLRKYARVHKIKTKPRIHKKELAASVSRHFANQTVKEVDTITCFLYTVHYRGKTTASLTSVALLAHCQLSVDSVLRLPLRI